MVEGLNFTQITSGLSLGGFLAVVVYLIWRKVRKSSCTRDGVVIETTNGDAAQSV